MFESLKSITEIPDLRKRILFSWDARRVPDSERCVPAPGINPEALEQAFNSMGSSLFGLLSMFSGGSLRTAAAVFALGIMPYITASIILQDIAPTWRN